MARKPIEFDDVITAFYEAATDASLWQPALATMTQLFAPSFAAHFFTWDKAKNVALSLVDRDELSQASDAYARYYAKIDPRAGMIAKSPVGSMMACHHYFDDAYVTKSEFYQDFMIKIGGRYVLGGKLMETSTISAIASIHRNPQQGPFEACDLRLFARLQPHLTQAARVFHKFSELDADRRRGAAALDHMCWGVIVADQDGKILELNAAAEAHLRRADAIRAREKQLETAAVGRAAELLGMIRNAAAVAGGKRGTPGGMIRLERSTGTGYLTILIAPLRQATHRIGVKPAASVILFIADSEQQPVTSSAVLAQHYGLTPSEASVALAISTGKTIEEIAELNGVSKNTVRVQTQSVLAKTGVRRQAELVRVILQLPTAR